MASVPLGGDGGLASSHSLAIAGLSFGAGPIRERIANHFRSAPVTTIQCVAGSSLYALHLLNIVPARALLFHPRLVGAPRWEVYRIVTSFLVIGTKPWDVIRSCVGLVYWQSPLERMIAGGGDRVSDGVLVRRGRNRLRKDGTVKSVPEWILTSPFLHQLLTSAALLSALSLTLYKDPPPTAHSPFLLLFPYSLFPSLEHSIRWLYALTDLSESVSLFGIIPIEPVYLPVAMCVAGGLGTWKEVVKGFVVALAVARIHKIRRGGAGSDDGDGIAETVVEFVERKAASWGRWLRSFVLRWRSENSAVATTVISAPRSAATPVAPASADLNQFLGVAQNLFETTMREASSMAQNVARQVAAQQDGQQPVRNSQAPRQGQKHVDEDAELRPYSVGNSWGPGRRLGE